MGLSRRQRIEDAVSLPGLDALVEARIAEAMASGEFDDLPGAGRPLDLDDDAAIAPELRVAHRILKNAGFVPAEVHARREIFELRALLATLIDGQARRQALARLALLEFRLEAAGARRPLRVGGYRGRLLEKFGAR
jgi:hypothetical protein